MNNFFMFGKIKAPEFAHDDIEYVNTKPFSLENLKGNIVLMDFWTYCCINCIRTVPDLLFLEETFAHDPFQVIGVHSAKFDNENSAKNVLHAIGRYEIHHPVILDKKREVWDAYSINAWPTLVLIDAQGYIRKTYSGEGHREELEADIKDLIYEGKKQNILTSKFTFSFSKEIEPSLLYFPSKLSIQDNTIAIANTNRNSIVFGEIGEDIIKVKKIFGTKDAGNRDGNTPQFNHPQGVLLLEKEIYVADTQNGSIRRIDRDTGLVATLPLPKLRSDWDIAIYEGSLFIAIAGSHQIGRFAISSQKFSIFAGNGYETIVDGYAQQASLAQTSGLSISDGILYFADSETSSIRYIVLKEPYIVNTIVGSGLFDFGMQDGNIEQALFQHPLGVLAEQAKIYVADTYNSAIRCIDLKTNTVSTLIASIGDGVCRIDDKECQVLGLNEPNDVKKWKDNLIISDTNNHLIRKYNLKTKVLSDLEIIE